MAIFQPMFQEAPIRVSEALMAISPTSTKRSIWLRRGDRSIPNPSGVWHDLRLSAIGNAAARETFVTATPHMAAIWTDLFESMLVPGPKLRWYRNGPGVGRDARIAYSSLLGRYIARAYLSDHEGVRVLVPLDVAKRRLQKTPYVIEKDPSSSRGLEADWIGFDDSGLVIVEAKGTFDKGVTTWRDQNSTPPILRTAIDQAARTAVFVRSPRRKLPAKRWAIASRWGTEENHREPTLLAWDPEEEKLAEEDYQALAKILLRADLAGVMDGLGYPEEAEQMLRAVEPSTRVSSNIQVHIGDQTLEPGFASLVGPFGVQPLRGKNHLLRMLQDRDLNLSFAVASLSSQYVETASQGRFWPEEKAAAPRSSHRAGLTVVWPEPSEDVFLAE